MKINIPNFNLDLTQFTKPDGSPIQSKRDMLATIKHSLYKCDGLELYGVTTRHGLVTAYTGNGPTSLANARLYAFSPTLLTALKTTHDRIIARRKNVKLNEDESELVEIIRSALRLALGLQKLEDGKEDSMNIAEQIDNLWK